ncbi:hypothetical protein M0813_29744 [Anaeramoeba flamelloides]|uniref:Uncharacterized protein n=1 Tax=Anaeramoeba flamelloides TaxID=1746091 RepID=A0ABQ8XLF1_9EUKA|nr:hypothetical protein M0813_29744 [Anaeramoeba flamelloides]
MDLLHLCTNRISVILSELQEELETPFTFIIGEESFDFYGSSILRERVSRYLIREKTFLNNYLMNVFLKECLSQKNLSQVFDSLDLSQLVNLFEETIDSQKEKKKTFDSETKNIVINSLIGKMSCVLFDSDRLENYLSKKVESVLEDFISLIIFCGEDNFRRKYTFKKQEQQTQKQNNQISYHPIQQKNERGSKITNKKFSEIPYEQVIQKLLD